MCITTTPTSSNAQNTRQQAARDEWDEEEDNQARNGMQEAIDKGDLSGWFSLFTFSWAEPFLRLGASRTLEENDLDGIYKYHKR